MLLKAFAQTIDEEVGEELYHHEAIYEELELYPIEHVMRLWEDVYLFG